MSFLDLWFAMEILIWLQKFLLSHSVFSWNSHYATALVLLFLGSWPSRSTIFILPSLCTLVLGVYIDIISSLLILKLCTDYWSADQSIFSFCHSVLIPRIFFWLLPSLSFHLSACPSVLIFFFFLVFHTFSFIVLVMLIICIISKSDSGVCLLIFF